MDNLNPETLTPPLAPSSSSKIKLIVSIVIVLILIGVISASAYYFKPAFLNKKDITLGQAFYNTAESFLENKNKSAKFSMKAELVANDISKNYDYLITDDSSKQMLSQIKDVSFGVNYFGQFVKNGTSTPDAEIDIKVEVKNPIGGSLGMFSSQEFAMKYKVISDDIYFNIQTLPSLLSMMLPPDVDLDKYLNQWFSMSISENVSYTAPTLPEKMNEAKILQFIDHDGVIVVTDQKSEKTESGLTVKAFYVKINWDKLEEELINFGKSKTFEENFEPLTKSEELQIKDGFKMIKESLVVNVFKVLVGEDGYIHGYDLSGDFVNEQKTKIGSLTLNFSLDNFNKVIGIEKPLKFKKFDEVIKEIGPSLMGI